MSRGERLSVMGLYNYKDGLFAGMVFPVGFSQDDQETVIANIVAECAELECLFPNWYTMFDMIRFWSKQELFTWQRIYDASIKQYNPIENYDRIENWTDTGESGSEISSSGTTSFAFSSASERVAILKSVSFPELS